MKKYFVTESDEEITFGDVIQLAFEKKLEDGKVTVEKEVVFNEDTLDILVDMGFIEERQIEVEDDGLPDTRGDCCEAFDALAEDFESLEAKVESLESRVEYLEECLRNHSKNAQHKPKK